MSHGKDINARNKDDHQQIGKEALISILEQRLSMVMDQLHVSLKPEKTLFKIKQIQNQTLEFLICYFPHLKIDYGM